ncbi:MAG: preprotein translocase subunit SecE [Myxococcota bacterium]|nr:preprotein translocase subunit SecE [Myxococcota bacterium]
MNNQRYINITLLSLAAVLAVSIRGLSVPLLTRLDVGDPRVFGLQATVWGAVFIGLVTFVILSRHPKVVSFSDASITALREVVWPDREETIRFTNIVIVITLFIAMALGLYDYLWAEITQLFLFTES